MAWNSKNAEPRQIRNKTLEDHILLEPYVFYNESRIKIAFNTPTMAQVGPITPPAALAAGAAAAPLAIPQAPTTYCEKFAGMGDLYGGAYLPLLHAHRPEVALTPALVAQMVLTLLTHDGLPSVYAYQTDRKETGLETGLE